ncbi:MAG: hypothetical protein IKP65_07650 [Alphaproteobacteria bacterium]|nr:hypothetical protein [Alphaproteobacteria bacterium]
MKKNNHNTHCIICGKELTKKQQYNDQKCCSPQCSAKNPDRKIKMKKTVKDRYGVDHFSKSSSFSNKIKKTWKNKSDDEIEKMNNQLEYTNLQKYGCKRPLQNKDIHKKMENTNLQKYGKTNVFANEEIKEKSKNTCLNKYGVENAMQYQEIKDKVNKTSLHRNFQKMKEKFKDYVEPLFDENEYDGVNDVVYKWKCVKCGNVFEQHIHKTQMNGDFCYIPRCLKCYPYVAGYSYMEKDVLNFIKSIYDGKIIEHDKIVLNGKELDIYLPEKQIAIEFDGSYWHSIEGGKNRNYHLNKTESCEEKGIHLIHVFEYQWRNKKDIIKQKLKSIINNDMEKVYARNCEIREIDSSVSNEFLEKYHIQGKDNAKIRIGLFHKNELVAIMTFGKPRFNKEYQYELIRYATNKHVIGGAGKALNYFKKNYKPESLITYADRCWSKGNMYEKLGFVKKGITRPNYVYIKNDMVLNRYQCQKHKLKKLLDNFDANLSESENMQLNGWNQFYDCGNLIYIKKYFDFS